jgi:uncharacterized Zn finger protein
MPSLRCENCGQVREMTPAEIAAAPDVVQKAVGRPPGRQVAITCPSCGRLHVVPAGGAAAGGAGPHG